MLNGAGFMSAFIACTRMYNACPVVTELWAALTEEISRASGVPLRFETHPWPLDIEDIWNRPDAAFVFVCGRAFALGKMRHKPVAAPVSSALSDGGSLTYHSKILVDKNSPFRKVEDLAGQRIGWTVEHSMSGYFAPRRHLEGVAPCPPARATGPLHTPANCLKALKDGIADAVPLDGYYYDLLARHNPAALGHTRVIAVTREYPIPFLASSPQTDDSVRAALSRAALEAAESPRMAVILESLGLTGFGAVVPAEYAFMAECPT
jgi:ABC-type phosphate/phosphonate transport system substrate-binding protein